MTSSRLTLQALPDPLPVLPAAGVALPFSITVHTQMEPLEASWRQLERDNLVSLHQGYDWCRTWAVTNPAPLLILEGVVGGETRFILPLEVIRRHGSRIARFIAGSHSNLNTGLVAPDLTALEPEAFLKAVKEAIAGRVDLLNLGNMPLLWRDRLSPFHHMDHTENQNRAFQLPLLPVFEETLKQVNAKRRRKKFRLQQRRLEQAGGYDIFRADDAQGRHALLDEFFRQKAERFRTQGLPDVFRDKATQAFFHALLDVKPEGDNVPLVLHGLRLTGGEHAGVVLAIAGVSRKGDHMVCQFGSIREDVIPDASPGEFLFWHVIEGACKTGAALFDFGIGDQLYKRSWCAVETVQYDVLVPLTARGVLSAGLQKGVIRAKAAIKGNPRLYALIQRLRAGSGTSAQKTAESGDED